MQNTLVFAGYEGESLTKLLHKIQRSSVVMMDRWQIEFSAPETGEEEQGDPIPCNIINNYFSLGVVSCFKTPSVSLSVLQRILIAGSRQRQQLLPHIQPESHVTNQVFASAKRKQTTKHTHTHTHTYKKKIDQLVLQKNSLSFEPPK